jgi:hypothetical protein
MATSFRGSKHCTPGALVRIEYGTTNQETTKGLHPVRHARPPWHRERDRYGKAGDVSPGWWVRERAGEAVLTKFFVDRRINTVWACSLKRLARLDIAAHGVYWRSSRSWMALSVQPTGEGSLPVQCSLALAVAAAATVVSGGSASPVANCVDQSASEQSPAASQTNPLVRLPEASRETAMATPVDGVLQPPWGRLPLFFSLIALNELRCCLGRCASTSHRRIHTNGEWDQRRGVARGGGMGCGGAPTVAASSTCCRLPGDSRWSPSSPAASEYLW